MVKNLKKSKEKEKEKEMSWLSMLWLYWELPKSQIWLINVKSMSIHKNLTFAKYMLRLQLPQMFLPVVSYFVA